MTTQEQQIQPMAEASNGEGAAAIVLSDSPAIVEGPKKRKKRKGPPDVTKINPVPADTSEALAQQDDAGVVIDLATDQSALTEEEKLAIVETLRRRKADRLTDISNFAAEASAQLDREISAALAQQAEIQRQKRKEAEAFMPPIRTDDLVALVKSMAERGRVLPGDYHQWEEEE